MTLEKIILKALLENDLDQLESLVLSKHDRTMRKDPDKYRDYFLKSPSAAYYYARLVDREPHEDTRKAASENPSTSYVYALHVDYGPHAVTRAGACKDPEYAAMYAKNVDKGFHKETLLSSMDELRSLEIYIRCILIQDEYVDLVKEALTEKFL